MNTVKACEKTVKTAEGKLKKASRRCPAIGLQYVMRTSVYPNKDEKSPTVSFGTQGNYKVDLITLAVTGVAVMAGIVVWRMVSKAKCAKKAKCGKKQKDFNTKETT